jgi:hypothetical protein
MSAIGLADRTPAGARREYPQVQPGTCCLDRMLVDAPSAKKSPHQFCSDHARQRIPRSRRAPSPACSRAVALTRLSRANCRPRPPGRRPPVVGRHTAARPAQGRRCRCGIGARSQPLPAASRTSQRGGRSATAARWWSRYPASSDGREGHRGERDCPAACPADIFTARMGVFSAGPCIQPARHTFAPPLRRVRDGSRPAPGRGSILPASTGTPRRPCGRRRMAGRRRGASRGVCARTGGRAAARRHGHALRAPEGRPAAAYWRVRDEAGGGRRAAAGSSCASRDKPPPATGRSALHSPQPQGATGHGPPARLPGGGRLEARDFDHYYGGC